MPTERDPERTLAVLEDQAIEDDGAELAAMSDAELTEALRAEGLDPEAAKKDAEAVARQMVVGGAAAEPVRAARRTRVVWLSAAAILLLVLGAIGLAGRAAIVAWMKKAPPPSIGPVPEDVLALPPAVVAARLRDEADQACAARLFETCKTKLDDARTLDPAGEDTERVARMRATLWHAAIPSPDRKDGKDKKSP